MIDTVEAVARAHDAVREILKRFLMERGEPLYTFSEAATDTIDALTALGWLPPESVERLLKHQHEIIGAQVASLEKADMEIERLSASHAAIERAALERAAAWHEDREAQCRADELTTLKQYGYPTPTSERQHQDMVTHIGSRNAILALAPSHSTWREVKEGWDVTPKEPTPEMTSAGIESDDKRTGGETCKHIFRHMIAARPQP